MHSMQPTKKKIPLEGGQNDFKWFGPKLEVRPISKYYLIRPKPPVYQ